MIPRWAEIMAHANNILTMCRARPDEKIAIYIDTGRPPELGQIFLGAAAALGADAYVVTAQMRRPTISPPEGAVAALKSADLVFDLATNSWLYSAATEEILATGARMLQVRASDSRFFDRGPRAKISEKAKLSVKLFEAADTIRITSPEGTDVTFGYHGRPPHGQDGIVENPGEWDSLGTAFCNTCPIEDSGEGTIVLNGPVYLSGGTSFITEDPIRLEVKGGQVVRIDGGAEGRRFQQYVDTYGDPASRVIAHVGYGYDPLCGPPPKPSEANDTGSWEAMNGGVIIAFGANRSLKRWGGRNIARTHSDCVLLGADFYLGETQVISKGKFVVPGFEE